jgi:hypothetical protein
MSLSLDSSPRTGDGQCLGAGIYAADTAYWKACRAHVDEAKDAAQARYDALCGPVTVRHA